MSKSENVGRNIRACRKKVGMTQKELAEKVFVSAQGVSNWELGASLPDLDNLCRLAEIFGITVDELLRDDKKSDNYGKNTYVGIDGGGTKTEFVLFNDDGSILRRVILSTSNPNDIGSERSNAVVAHGLDILFETSPSISHIFAGIAGMTVGENRKNLSDFIKKQYPNVSFSADSDAVNVISSGGAGDSAALICGTGSVLYIRKNGEFRRLGGWGYLFDGAGSAYDIGADGIKSALAEFDGVGRHTLITKKLEKKLGGDIWASLDKIYSGSKVFIASLSSVVFEAFYEGDEIAREIIEKNCKYLANLASIAAEKYGVQGDIIACGGIFSSYRDAVLPFLEKYKPSGVNYFFPELPPVYGACVECFSRSGGVADEKFYENFRRDYKNL